MFGQVEVSHGKLEVFGIKEAAWDFAFLVPDVGT